MRAREISYFYPQGMSSDGGYPIPLSQRDVRFTFYNQQANPIDRETAFAEWKSRFADIVNVGEKTGADIVIFNSIPTFPDPLPDSIENPQWFNAWSNLKYRKPSRSELLSVYSSVDNHFRDLSLTKSNVHVFDIFQSYAPRMKRFAQQKAIWINGIYRKQGSKRSTHPWSISCKCRGC